MSNELKVERTSVSTYTVTFRCVADKELDNDTISNLQSKAGYYPQGYGGPDKIKRVQEDGKWVHTWECSGSAD